jgi:hypothetical protein
MTKFELGKVLHWTLLVPISIYVHLRWVGTKKKKERINATTLISLNFKDIILSFHDLV